MGQRVRRGETQRGQALGPDDPVEESKTVAAETMGDTEGRVGTEAKCREPSHRNKSRPPPAAPAPTGDSDPLQGRLEATCWL